MPIAFTIFISLLFLMRILKNAINASDKVMKEQLLDKIHRELINGCVKKKHPFRYFSLATVEENQPIQRTVVLRKVLKDFTLVFFTDSRSAKVEQLLKNSNSSALFYHPKQMVQLRLNGKSEFVESDVNSDLWNNIQGNARRDYTTKYKPGSPLKSPDCLLYDDANNYFKVVHFVPESLEFLQLKRPNHLRLCYRRCNGHWEGEFMVP